MDDDIHELYTKLLLGGPWQRRCVPQPRCIWNAVTPLDRVSAKAGPGRYDSLNHEKIKRKHREMCVKRGGHGERRTTKNPTTMDNATPANTEYTVKEKRCWNHPAMNPTTCTRWDCEIRTTVTQPKPHAHTDTTTNIAMNIFSASACP